MLTDNCSGNQVYMQQNLEQTDMFSYNIITSQQVVIQNSHEASLAGERQKKLDSLRKCAVHQIDREEKEIKQCLRRLNKERELLLQLNAMQGKNKM